MFNVRNLTFYSADANNFTSFRKLIIDNSIKKDNENLTYFQDNYGYLLIINDF